MFLVLNNISSFEEILSLKRFKVNPLPFYQHALSFLPNPLRPSLSHQFISLLESKNKLQRNYSQNVDGVENLAGITRVIQCHGSIDTSTCLRCGYTVPTDSLREFFKRQVCTISVINDSSKTLLIDPRL